MKKGMQKSPPFHYIPSINNLNYEHRNIYIVDENAFVMFGTTKQYDDNEICFISCHLLQYYIIISVT